MNSNLIHGLKFPLAYAYDLLGITQICILFKHILLSSIELFLWVIFKTVNFCLKFLIAVQFCILGFIKKILTGKYFSRTGCRFGEMISSLLFHLLIFMQWDLGMKISFLSFKSDMDIAGWGRKQDVWVGWV